MGWYAADIIVPASDQGSAPVRDFARKEWPLRGSSADVRRQVIYGRRVADEFAERYGDLRTGSYDCVDRIVLNAYYPLGHNPGGFRVWWRRWHGDSDEGLDDAHLMRLAGRFAGAGAGVGEGERRPGDRLQGRGAQARDRGRLPVRACRQARRLPDPGGPVAGLGCGK